MSSIMQLSELLDPRLWFLGGAGTLTGRMRGKSRNSRSCQVAADMYVHLFSTHMQLFIARNRHVAADMYVHFPNAHALVHPRNSACCSRHVRTFVPHTHASVHGPRERVVHVDRHVTPPPPSKCKSRQISIDVGALIFDRLDPFEDFLHRNVVRGEKLIIRGSVVEACVESL